MPANTILTPPPEQPIDQATMAAIVQSLDSTFPPITQVHFISNSLTDAEVAVLATTHTPLTLLTLRNQLITDATITTLVKHFPNLQELDLSYNKITGKGALELAKHSKLTSLNLDYNEVDDLGLSALAKSPTLRKLSIQGNKFSVNAQAQEAFLRNHTLSQLTLDNTNISPNVKQLLFTHIQKNAKSQAEDEKTLCSHCCLS